MDLIKKIWNSINKVEVIMMLIVMSAGVGVLGYDIYINGVLSVLAKLAFFIVLGLCWVIMAILIVFTNIPDNKFK